MKAKRGDSIYDFCRRLCDLARSVSDTVGDVLGTFDGTEIRATSLSDPNQLAEAYRNGLLAHGEDTADHADEQVIWGKDFATLEAIPDGAHERTNELITQILVELHEISHRHERTNELLTDLGELTVVNNKALWEILSELRELRYELKVARG